LRHKEGTTWCYRIFRSYLIGTPFTIRTDHGSLTWIQKFKQPEGIIGRWLQKLQEYQFTVVHRPGRLHSNADSMSRLSYC